MPCRSPASVRRSPLPCFSSADCCGAGLLSAVIYRERITLRRVTALLLTLCGCVLVAGLLGSGVRLTPRVLATGLGSGLFYALYTVIRLEKGLYNPSLKLAMDIAKVFETSVESLFSFDEK